MATQLIDFPFISVIIPTMNRKSDLLECLTSLQKIDYPKNRIELLIWDNASSDGSTEGVKSKFQEMYRENWANLVLIEGDVNLGQYVPYNQIRSKINGKSQCILGLDDDVIVSENCLESMLEIFKQETFCESSLEKIVQYIYISLLIFLQRNSLLLKLFILFIEFISEPSELPIPS